MELPENIVIFDGDCAFCNRSVLFVLRKDKTFSIHACSSQSSAGQKLISQYNITESPEATLIFINKEKVLYRSNAALAIALYLKGGYPVLIICKIIPRFIRDGIYNIIAKHRHKLLKQNCELITDENIKARILE